LGYGSERCLLSEVCDCEASQDRRLPSQLLLLVVLLWLQSLDLVDGVVEKAGRTTSVRVTRIGGRTSRPVNGQCCFRPPYGVVRPTALPSGYRRNASRIVELRFPSSTSTPAPVNAELLHETRHTNIRYKHVTARLNLFQR